MAQKNRKGYGLLLFLLLLVLFIWLQSLQQGSISHRESQWVLKMVQRLFSGHWLGIWLNDGRIRRLAHTAGDGGGKIFQFRIISLGIAIASMDEIFQYCASGRTATWKY